MKKTVFVKITISLLIALQSCREESLIIPELISMPEVNYMYEAKDNDTNKKITIFINAYSISNEITNRQYREFTDWAKNNPEETLYKSKEVIARSYPESGKKLVYNLPWPTKVSDLIPTLIDSNALYKIDKRFKDYFTDSRFDEFPVVGVSRNAAEYYCRWLNLVQIETKTKRLKVKGRLFPAKVTTATNSTGTYRLPSELEWQNVSNHQYKRRFQNDYSLHRVTEGASNVRRIFHIHDNVSEWVISENDTLGLSRGGNWIEKDIAIDQYRLHPDSSNGYTGFRIVMTYEPEYNEKKK
jgi:hypothetical protein